MVRGFMVVLALVFSVACGEFHETVASYCDKEVYYSLRKQSEGFRLHLEVGRETERFCSVTPRGVREISLVRNVPSKEEAFRLIDEYRKKISGKIEPSASVRHVTSLPSVRKPIVQSMCTCTVLGSK